MQCALCAEEIKADQAHHYMAGLGKVHRTCRKAFDRGLLAAADVVKKHGQGFGGSIDPAVIEAEIREATSEFFDGD